jgi:hypothetical protein
MADEVVFGGARGGGKRAALLIARLLAPPVVQRFSAPEPQFRVVAGDHGELE